MAKQRIFEKIWFCEGCLYEELYKKGDVFRYYPDTKHCPNCKLEMKVKKIK